MSTPQHFGWFFSRGFGPQGWNRSYYPWNYDWTKPELYQHSIRTLEQAGFDLVIMEDALSLGSAEAVDLRVREAYGGPKHDPLMLAPYLFAATSRIGIATTVNPLAYPPYLAARQFASLAHLSGDRFGINVVTDTGSSRHFGLDPIPHDAAYDRAQEWLELLRRLWHSWDGPRNDAGRQEAGALIADPDTGRFADSARMDPFEHAGRYFRAAGPLNALPLSADPVVVSPGGSARGIDFAGAHSQVQLAATELTPDSVRAYRAKVLAAAAAHGRRAHDIRILFVFSPEVVATADDAQREVAASAHPSDALLRQIAAAQSSDLEVDLTTLELDRPIDPSIFGEHVSRGSLQRLLGAHESFAEVSLRELLGAKARKRLITDGGTVGTAEQVADLVQQLATEADNDGFIFNGDLHPVTVHRTLGELVPVLRRRGLLRDRLGEGGLRAHLFDG